MMNEPMGVFVSACMCVVVVEAFIMRIAVGSG